MPKGDNITAKHASRIPAGHPSRERKQRLYPYTRRVLQTLIAARDPMTINDLREALRMNAESVREAIIFLQSEHLVHIAEWRRGTGPVRRAFAAGKGKDAERLAPMPGSARNKRWRATNLDMNAQRIARNMTLAGQLGAA